MRGEGRLAQTGLATAANLLPDGTRGNPPFGPADRASMARSARISAIASCGGGDQPPQPFAHQGRFDRDVDDAVEPSAVGGLPVLVRRRLMAKKGLLSKRLAKTWLT